MQTASTNFTQQLEPKIGYGALQLNFCVTPQYSISTSSTYGMVMPGRSISSKSYRYGFNGKEKDNEGMGGGGSTYDYGFRIYNPQIAKFLSVDPLHKDYPWYTPYQFAGNKPIAAIDLDGLEEYIVVRWYNNSQLQETTVIKVPNSLQNAANLGNGTIYIELNNDVQGIAAYQQLFGGQQGMTTNTESKTNFSAVISNGNLIMGSYQAPSENDANGLRPYERDIVNKSAISNRLIKASDDPGDGNSISAQVPSLPPTVVNFPNNVSTLDENDKTTLNRAKRTLENYPSLTANVVGSTDANSSNQFNQELGLSRAQSVANYITNSPQLNNTVSPINPNRLNINSTGESNAIQNNASSQQQSSERSATISINYPSIGQ